MAKLSVSYGDHSIKQYHTVEYLGSHLGAILSSESMGMQVLKKSVQKLNFFTEKTKYLTLKSSKNKLTPSLRKSRI